MTNATNKLLTENQRRARAKASTDIVFHELRDYIPRNCEREAYDKLERLFYTGNVCLIKVAPEWDHLNEQQLTQAHLQTHPIFVKP